MDARLPGHPLNGTRGSPGVNSLVVRMQWSNVMRFTKVIPGENFNELRRELEHFVQPGLDKIIREEDPILVVTAWAVMGAKPRGDGYQKD